MIMDDTMAIHACPLVTQRVVLRGLKSEEFNGRFGEVMGFDNTTGRYIVSDFERQFQRNYLNLYITSDYILPIHCLSIPQ